MRAPRWVVIQRRSGLYLAKRERKVRGDEVLWAYAGGGEAHARSLARQLNEEREEARAERRARRAA